jgi:myo-inositol-1(or 4)-monophosphatase
VHRLENHAAVKHSRARRLIKEVVVRAGEVLLTYFGRVRQVRQKENISSVVCEADLASEALVIKAIRARFPDDGIIAEESGYQPGNSGRTWAIDPLDGTSNFVAGIPWFGAQVGLLEGLEPVMAAIYLPTEDRLYFAEKDRGLTRNGKRLRMRPEMRLDQMLCAFGFDPGLGAREGRQVMDMLQRVASGSRNIRATNSLVDFLYTLEGHFGGAINLNTRIWDIVPFAVMLPEAGGRLTDVEGRPIVFEPSDVERRYTVVGASHAIHPQLLKLIGPKRLVPGRK